MAVSGRFYATKSLTIGADSAYAIDFSGSIEEGFYDAIKVQYGFTEAINIVEAYRGTN